MTSAGAAPVTTPREALDALSAISADFAPELLAVAQTGADPPQLAAMRPTAGLAAALREVVSDHASDWTSRELVDYSPAASPADGQIMWVAAQDVPLLAWSELDRDLADMELFDAKAGYAAHLRLTALRAPTPVGQATFYRELRPKSVLSRSDKIAIFRRGDRMDLLAESAVLIDSGVDAIVVAGFALFVNRTVFQRVFGFLAEIRSQAATTFDEVTSNLAIDGLPALRAAATSQPAMLGKMSSIARKLRAYPAYRQAITMPKLVEFVRSHPHTGVEVSGQGASAKLVFRADAQHRFKILKLLDDDYLQSQLTQFEYESNSKGEPLV